MSAVSRLPFARSLPLSVALALALIGCRREVTSSSVVVTNFVERTVVVTNVVTRTVVVTNTVAVSAAMDEVPLTKRRTAVYSVSTPAMRGAELRKFLIGAGARVIECSPGAVATIEAPIAVMDEVCRGGLVSARPFIAADRLVAVAPAGVRQYCITPVSSLDCASIAAGVRELGGELIQVVTVGESVVKAKLSAAAVRRLAERSDILKIKEESK